MSLVGDGVEKTLTYDEAPPRHWTRAETDALTVLS